MSSDKPVRDWRTRSKSTAAAPSRGAAPERKSWRKGRSGSGARRPSKERQTADPTDRRRDDYGRGLKIAGLAMLGVGMVVAWLVYLAMMPRQTPLVAMRVTQYPDSLGISPNAQAEEDLLRFRESFQNRTGSSRTTSTGNTNVGYWEQERRPEEAGNFPYDAVMNGLLGVLDQSRFRPGGPRRNVVIFHLSGHGTLNAQGEPCILASDSRPFDPNTWFPIRELLRGLGEHPGVGGRSGTKKLVLLDVHHWLTHERSGILYNDFPTALNQVVQDLGDPNLYVMNSTSPGEIAWSSPGLRGSIFGFFVAEGLNGYADKNEDGTIRLLEFHEYLRDSVSSWVQRRRGTTQTPQLMTMHDETPDISLVHAPQRPSPMAEGLKSKQGEIEQQLQGRNRQLGELTRSYQHLLQQGAAQRFPLPWGQLEFRIVQADMLLTAGSAYDVEYQGCVQQIQDLLARMSESREREGNSLPLQHAMRFDLQDKTRQRLVLWREKPTIEEWKEPLDHVEAVDLAWNWLGDGSAATKLPTALRLIELGGPASGPELVEAHFLRLLHAHVNPQTAADEIEQALAVRGQAEHLAARVDLRGLSWLESGLTELDQRRREAEDALYLGTTAGLSQARSEFSALTQDYQQLEEQAEKLATAFGLRDELFRLGPALIRWATWRSRADESAEPLQQVTSLIDNVHALTRLLEPTDKPRLEVGLPKIVEISERTSETLNRVRDRYHEHCVNLLEQRADDQIIIQSLWQALRIPTLDPRVDRQRLRERYLNLLLENQGDLVEADPRRAARAESGETSPSDVADESTLTNMTAMGVHPLVRLMDRRSLQLPATTTQLSASLSPLQTAGLTGSALRASYVNYLQQQGETLRQMMSDTEATILSLTDEAKQTFAGAAPESAFEARRQVSSADRLLRATSGTLGNALKIEREQQPAGIVYALDQRHYFLWQAARALDDFWGPVVAERVYFAETAQNYLQLAGTASRQIVPSMVPLRYRGIDLAQLRQQRWDDVRRGLLPRASGLTLHEGENLPAHEIQVSPPEAFPSGSGYLTVMNPNDGGRAVPLLVENSTGQPEEISRLPLRLASAQVEPSRIGHQFRRQDLPEGSLEAFTFYRGHQWDSPIYITSPGFGQQVLVQPAPPQVPTVTVSGPNSRPMAIMLIFDCSSSMNDKVDIVDGRERNRMEVAREAVYSVLENLLRQRDVSYRIGLTLYGHRAGTNKENKTEYRPNERFPQLQGREPLHPAADVQIVIDLEREFNQERLDELGKILDSLQPWGQTPLYYSIKEAETYLRTRFRQGDQVDRRLLVLTDGVNYQFRTGAPDGVMTRFDGLDETTKWLKEQNIQMDILALDVIANKLKAEEKKTVEVGVRELRELATATGGKYYDLRSTTELNREIEAAINPGEFAIRPASVTAPATFQPFGMTWKPDGWENRRQPYVLNGRGVGREVNEHRFQLEGGEALQVQLLGDQFVHQRFTPGKFFEEERTQDGTFNLRVPIPRRVSGSGVHFQVAMQHFPETRFTPRPRHLWAEITPIGSRQDRDARSPLLAYYDLEFLPGFPVPVLQFRATNWPEFANEAELRLWFRTNDDVVPNAAFTLSDLREASRYSAGEVPGVEFEVEVTQGRDGSGREVKVWEIHPSDAPVEKLYSLRLQVEPQADEWSHRFIPDSRRVLHTFRYAGSTQPKRLLVTTRERLTSGALTLEKPFRLVLERR